MAKQWMNPDALFRKLGQSWECPEMRDTVDHMNGGGSPRKKATVRKAAPATGLTASWSSSSGGTA